MSGPVRLFLCSRPTGQPSSHGVPCCYRSDATDDGAACAMCYSFGTQQVLLAHFPSCILCRAGMTAAALYYADRARP